jgi:hypothetical protein
MSRALVVGALLAGTARGDKPTLEASKIAIKALTDELYRAVRHEGGPIDAKVVLPRLADKVSYAGVVYFDRAIQPPTAVELACERRFGARGEVTGAARTEFIACGSFWASAMDLSEPDVARLPEALDRYAPIAKRLAATHRIVEGEFAGALSYTNP